MLDKNDLKASSSPFSRDPSDDQLLVAVEQAIADLPQVNYADFDAEKHKIRAKLLISAFGESLLKCSDDNEQGVGKWQAALCIWWHLILSAPFEMEKYIKETQLPPSQQHTVLRYDRIPSGVFSPGFQYTPIEAVLKSLFILRKQYLEREDLLETYAFLMHTFRAMGWGRAITLREIPPYSLEDFRKYVEQQPGIFFVWKEISAKTQAIVMKSLILAFKSGEEEDRACLEKAKKSSELLMTITPLPKEVCSLISEYFGFFRPRVTMRAPLKQVENYYSSPRPPS